MKDRFEAKKSRDDEVLANLAKIVRTWICLQNKVFISFVNVKSYNGDVVDVMIVCDYGKYGIECKDECGHCRDVSQCVYTNGSCLTGCKDGYQGELCKTRAYIQTKLFNKCLYTHSMKFDNNIELTGAHIWYTVYPVTVCMYLIFATRNFPNRKNYWCQKKKYTLFILFFSNFVTHE